MSRPDSPALLGYATPARRQRLSRVAVASLVATPAGWALGMAVMVCAPRLGLFGYRTAQQAGVWVMATGAVAGLVVALAAYWRIGRRPELSGYGIAVAGFALSAPATLFFGLYFWVTARP